jgi:hypothetical protein
LRKRSFRAECSEDRKLKSAVVCCIDARDASEILIPTVDSADTYGDASRGEKPVLLVIETTFVVTIHEKGIWETEEGQRLEGRRNERKKERKKGRKEGANKRRANKSIWERGI